MIVFSGESMKSREVATTGGTVWEHGVLLVKSTTEMLVILPVFYPNNEFF